MRRSENDTHPIVESDTVEATVPKRSVDPNYVRKPLDPEATCETSVYDVLFAEDCKTSAFKTKGKTNRPWLELRRVLEDDHEHLVAKSK